MYVTDVFNMRESENFCKMCLELISALGSSHFSTDRTRNFVARLLNNKAAIGFPPEMDTDDEYVNHLWLDCYFMKGIDAGMTCDFPVICIHANMDYMGLENGFNSKESKLELAVSRDNIAASQNLVANAIYHVFNENSDTDFNNGSRDFNDTNDIGDNEINFIYNLTAILSIAGPEVLNSLGHYINIIDACNNELAVKMYIDIKGIGAPLLVEFRSSRDSSTGKIHVNITTSHNGTRIDTLECNVNDHALSKVVPGISHKFKNSLNESISLAKGEMPR